LSQLKKYEIPVCVTLNRLLKSPSKETVKKIEANAILVIKMRQGVEASVYMKNRYRQITALQRTPDSQISAPSPEM